MRNIILTAIILSLITIGTACNGSRAENKNTNTANNAAANEPVNITVAQAVVRDVPTYFEATGSLASDAQTDVAPLVGGKVTEVNFDVGSFVTKGSVLVRLDDRDARIRLEQAERQVEQGQAQIEQAKAAVRQAQAGVEQARANLRQTQARLGVKDGETFDIENFSQVRATRAQLDLAEKELQRVTRLLETGDVSRSIYDQRKAQRDQLLAQLDEARATAAVAVRAIGTAQEGVRTAQVQVNSAEANVVNVQRAVETSKVQVEQARKAIADAVVLAPISGYVSERNADLGEFISTQNKVCTIVRTAVLRMKIDVPEQNISQVREGQSVSLNVSAYPDRNFSGVVTRVYPNVNTTSRTLTVEAEVDNGNGLLKPGQFATVRIAQSQTDKAVYVPKSAIKNDNGLNKVFVIENGIAIEKIVQTGSEEGDYVEIRQGIREGEKVATGNLDKLSEGVSVIQ
jgi:RND family efflux transporter MFP subunit